MRSALTFATVVTSTVLPGNTQCRTGKPSRVTASPTITCGTSPRPFFDFPRFRTARYVFAPAAREPLTSSSSPTPASSSSTSKCKEVVS